MDASLGDRLLALDFEIVPSLPLVDFLHNTLYVRHQVADILGES